MGNSQLASLAVGDRTCASAGYFRVTGYREAKDAKDTCDGKLWEAWKEPGRWHVASHGWYPAAETGVIHKAQCHTKHA